MERPKIPSSERRIQCGRDDVMTVSDSSHLEYYTVIELKVKAFFYFLFIGFMCIDILETMKAA